MPIVRMAVDWGDGGEPYVMKGWFKNRKGEGKCGKVQDLFDGTGQRVHFGDSNVFPFDACETGFYEFKHVYQFPTGTLAICTPTLTFNCLDNTTGSFRFKPKVHVLDNWGWCNGVDSGGNPKGYWNDDKTITEEAKKPCSWTQDEPWTKFSKTIEVKP